MSFPSRERSTLLAAGLAAVLASTCCLGPLVLLTLGIGGAWIAHLTALEPYRPVFIAVAAVALIASYRRIFRPASACEPGELCAIPQVRRAYQALFTAVAVLLLVAIGYPFLVPYFY